MKNWGCEKHSCLTSSGRRSNRSCLEYTVAAALGPITAKCSKAFFGCSRPVPGGAICPRSIPVPAPVGDGCGNGKSKRYGSKSGGSFSVNWTNAANWIGANHSWTAALLPLKRGRLRRQNQARQGHEVDGGGRRPRCSFGKPTGLGQPGGSDAGREHAQTDPFRAQARAGRNSVRCASLPTGVTTATHCAGDCSSVASCSSVLIAKADANPRSTTDALCVAIANVGKSNAPSLGWATSADCSCAMIIKSPCTQPSSISPASSSPSDTYETASSQCKRLQSPSHCGLLIPGLW